MRKLDLKESSNVRGGDKYARLMKQWHKCVNGSSYACGRVNRMYARHFA
tara:strand:+ start:169 stop:315 length:147 start_codon:yes stop_codon:yes gene_type:complete